MFFLRLLLIVALALSPTACRKASQVEESGPGGLPKKLSEKAKPLTPEQIAAIGATPTQTAGSSGSPGSPGARSTSAAPGTTSGSSSPGGRPYRTVGTVTDIRGDSGVNVAAYSDIASITIEDDGQNARITIEMAGSLPTRLAVGEVMGLGVDLYRQDVRESDFQVFADGSSEGWFAYLQTPRGFIEYPGTFGIGGSKLVFVVPWSSFDSIKGNFFSSFADWSRKGDVVNESAQDNAPTIGKSSFAR